uniref:ISXO2-like transposase domain-containing protein n=1 Tax=Amphimedon queenslandica TaxID=400682 RepID=A0A1X7SXL4_AMPQE
SVIYSDLWGAYNGLDRLLGQNYTHHTVNHSQHFVDPVTGAHTQSVELMSSQCKRMVRKMQTMYSQLFHTYLPEFMWRKKFDGPHQNAFNNIISSIVEQYPLIVSLYLYHLCCIYTTEVGQSVLNQAELALLY